MNNTNRQAGKISPRLTRLLQRDASRSEKTPEFRVGRRRLSCFWLCRGGALGGFSSLCLRASLWAFEGRKEDGEKDEDGTVVRQKNHRRKGKDPLTNTGKN